MTDQEINVAIAELLGRKYHKPAEQELESGSYYQYEPDFCQDLNLMRWAEQCLSNEQYEKFGTALVDMSEREHVSDVLRGRFTLSATARHRAEAFLRALGKWKE